MKTLTHSEGHWYCVYDKATKKVLVGPRECIVGVQSTYDDTRVSVLIAPSEADLNSLIIANTLVR